MTKLPKTEIDTKRLVLEQLNYQLSAIYKDDVNKPVFVPTDTLGKEIIDKLSDVDGNVLVLSDLGLLIALLNRIIVENKTTNSVLFVCHNKEQENFAAGLGINTLNIGYEDPITQLESLEMKFDVIVGNPPYQNGLHMQFLEFSLNQLSVAGELIFVHPSTNFINLKDVNQPHAKVIDSVAHKIKQLQLINGKIFFDVNLFIPCAITHIKNDHDNKNKIYVVTTDGIHHTFDGLNKVNRFGNLPEIFSLMEKVQKYQNIWDSELRKNQQEFVVQFSGIRGHISNDNKDFVHKDFWTVLGNHVTVIPGSQLTRSAQCTFWFKTKNEGENFISYLKTKFVRRLVSFYKNNQHLDRGELSIIPQLDFTKSWDDKKLAKHFKLTKEEQAFIDLIPAYYD